MHLFRPKTARPEAPDAFRMDLVEQPVLSCEDDGASRPKKLILNPTTQNMPSSAGVSNKRAWLIALAAATSVADMRLSSQPMSVSIPIVTVDLVDGHQVALYHCLVVDSLNGAQQRLGSHRCGCDSIARLLSQANRGDTEMCMCSMLPSHGLDVITGTRTLEGFLTPFELAITG